jgi:hypothetical protein
VIIPDPLPYPEESAVEQRRPAPAVVPPPRQPSSLFTSPPAAGPVQPAPTAQMPGESVTRSLFQHATGLFRKRGGLVSPPAQEPAFRQREPAPVDPATPVAAAGELVMEPERPADRRTSALDDSGLEIPAFRRRQTSSA